MPTNAKASANASNKTQKQENKKTDSNSLTTADKFYIDNHGNLTVEQLAEDLGKPFALVKNYCKEYAQKAQRTRAKKAMSRPAKHGGVISMTEAASMIGDESRNTYVTIEAINKAISEGKTELVKTLKEKYETQQEENKNVIRNKYTNVIHYIESPDDDADLGLEGI